MDGTVRMTAPIPLPGSPEAAARVQCVLESSRDVLDRAKHFKPAPRFTLLDDSEIAQLPAPTWLIHGVLPSNGLISLVGAPKSYKSFVALDWACHVALGLDWHDRAVKQGPVVYVYAEGVSGLRQRMEAWKRYARLDSTLGVYFLPRRVTINGGTDAQDLLDAIKQRVSGPPVLIVIDTLNRNFSGNENSSEDMGAFVEGCDLLREATGAAVLPVHHKGHGAEDRGRGSSVFEAACDAVILCTRDEERVTLDCKWMKDGQDGWQLAMEALPIAPSLVLKPSGVNAGGLKGQRLACLRVLHQNYTADGAAYKSWLEASGLRSSSFNKAREWLQGQDYVKSDAGKWKCTDAGRQAIGNNSTNSTATPLVGSGVGSTLLHRSGGIEYPRSGVRPGTCQ